MERTYNSDPTPAESEPLVPPGVGVVRSWSHSESSRSIGVSRSRRVQWACDQTFHFVVFFFCLSLCACTSYLFGRPTPLNPDDLDFNRFRTTPNDPKRLRKSPGTSGRLGKTPGDSERLWIMLGGPTFPSRFQNYRSQIGVDSGFCQLYSSLV